MAFMLLWSVNVGVQANCRHRFGRCRQLKMAQYEETRTSALLNTMKAEYVICAAIHYNDWKTYEHQPRNIATGFVIAGRRHHNCIITLAILAQKDWRRDNLEAGMCVTQGFLSSRDRFLTRQEAWVLAVEAKQIEANEKENTMFSEDLY